jgi:hypothetical protein
MRPELGKQNRMISLDYYDPSGSNQDLNANHTWTSPKKDFPAIFKAAGLDPTNLQQKYTSEEKEHFKLPLERQMKEAHYEGPANMGGV